MFKFLKKIFRRKAGIPGVLDLGLQDPFAMWRNSKRVPAGRAMDVYAGWVYACIRAIAEEIANMKIRLFRISGNDADNDEELFDHPILDLLNGANETQTGYEVRYAIATHLELAGNAYVLLQGVKDETKPPTALYLLNPAGVKVQVDKTQFPYKITGYQYRTPEARIFNFKPYEILHIRYPDPNDPVEGIGTVQASAQWIDADNYAMEFNRRFFLNGARIGGFIESENAQSPEQIDYLKKSFEAVYKGVENAYKVSALPAGTKYTPASTTQKDMDFVQLSQAMLTRILAAFRVPKSVLGITEDVNRANAEASNYVFALRNIKPKMGMIVNFLNEFLVPRFGDDLYLDFEDPVPENTTLKIAEMEKAIGILTPNEMRERYFELGGVEGGDEPLIPFTLRPLGKPLPKKPPVNPPADELEKPEEEKPPGDETPTEAPPEKRMNRRRPPISRFARNRKVRKEIAEKLASAAAEAWATIQTQVKEAKTKGLQNLSDEQFAPVYKVFADRVGNYVELMREQVERINIRQRNTVIENLPKAVKAVDAAALFDKKEWIGITVDLSTPILENLFETEAKEAANLLGTEPIDYLADPAAAKALDRAIELMAKTYNETTLDQLKAALEKGLSDGQGIPGLSKLVEGVYNKMGEENDRADELARTVTFRVANDATKEAFKQSGVVKTMRWYTAEDERVCPYCGPLDGKVVSIDDNFFEKGDEAQGSDGTTLPLDYSDIGAPPLHVFCRCYIRPEDISLE